MHVVFRGSTDLRVSVSTTKPSETRSRSIEENTRLRSHCETSLSRREVGTLDSFRFLDVAPLLVISPGYPREVATAALSYKYHLISFSFSFFSRPLHEIYSIIAGVATKQSIFWEFQRSPKSVLSVEQNLPIYRAIMKLSSDKCTAN